MTAQNDDPTTYERNLTNEDLDFCCAVMQQAQQAISSSKYSTEEVTTLICIAVGMMLRNCPDHNFEQYKRNFTDHIAMGRQIALNPNQDARP